MTSSPQAPAPTLRRELGKWDLTAIGVNQVIGAAIFATPGTIAALVGGWSWLAVAMVATLAMLIALNFAEAGSRFDTTGGAYLYTRAAFGRFPSFEVGWMLWVTRATSWASVVNALTDALGYYWPEVRAGLPRAAVISAVILTIMVINVRGIRQSAIAVNILTIGKLTPLVIFIVLGLPHISVDALRPEGAVALTQASSAALLLIFAFGGYEVISVPAGEARDPKRAVPFAMITTIAVVAVVMILVQIVALGTLPGLPSSKTPLADAAAVFIGAWGAFIMTTGAAVSMTGNNVGQALSGSRNLFALAEQGDLPKVFGHVHSKFRTPDFAIVFTSLVALGLALGSDFRTLAASSAVARLVVYTGTCTSVLKLRRTGRAPFTIPFGPVVPILALALSIAIMFGATALQLRVGAVALVLGAVLYLVARRTKGDV
jgi:amino acid transporter